MRKCVAPCSTSASPDPEQQYTCYSQSLPVFERIIRDTRARLGIALSSSVNLFLANGHQLAAVRICFDFD